MTPNNRWFQLVACVVAMIMIANLQYAWTLFVKPIQAASGWKLSDVQLAFTLFVLFQTWVQPLDGWLIDRLGPRAFISAAGVLCGLGWAGLGLATTMPAFYVLYCTAGVGAAFVYSGSIGSALKWFKDRRGLAAGIIAAGFGGGTALSIPIISSIIKTQGYRSAFIMSGIVQGLVILGVAQLLRHPPRAEQSAAPVATAAASGVALGRRQFTTIEMVRTRQFYMMYVMFVLMATGGLLVTAQSGAIAQSWGYPVAVLTMATSLSPLANAASRIFWGWSSDRIGRETSMMIAFALQALCLFMVLALGPRSSNWFVVTLVLVYFTWGEIFSLFPSTVGDYFGTRHATSNYSVLYTAKGVASIGVWLGAKLFERLGDWAVAFRVSVMMAVIAAVLATALRMMRAVNRTRELAAAAK